MSITLINSDSIAGGSTAAKNKTFTCNSDFLVVAFGSFDEENNYLHATGVTYGGEALTRAVRAGIRQGGDTDKRHHCEIWYKAGPASGSNTITISYSKTTTFTGGAAWAYNGVLQSGMLDDTDTDTTDSQTSSETITLVAEQGNTLFIDSHQIDNGSIGNPSNPTRDEIIEVNYSSDSFQSSAIADVAAGSDNYVSGGGVGNRYMVYCGALFAPALRGGAALLTLL